MPRPSFAAVGAAVLVAAVVPRPIAGQRATFSVERIAEDRGLSNSNVTAVTQGRNGFLWVGTQDGLNLYDGTGFTVLRTVPGDTNSLSESWVTSLAAGRDGSLWVGTLHSGISRIAPGMAAVRRYRHVASDPASLAASDINTLIEGRDGGIWVGTPTGLDRLDPASGRVRHYVIAVTGGDSSRARNDVISLSDTRDGPLWVGTRGGLYRFDRESGRFTAVPLELQISEVRAILLTRNQRTMWIGTQRDLVALDVRSLAVTHRFSGSTILGGANSIAEGPDGTIWVATNEGVTEIDPRTETVSPHTSDPLDPHSLAGSIARAVFVDRGGVLWIGGESYGLAKHAPAAVSFELLRKGTGDARSLSDGYIRGIAADRENNIWIGTQNGGLDRLDARTKEITVYRHRAGDPSSLPGDNVWAFLEDHTGTTWVGLHERGLGTFDRATGRFERFALVPWDASVNTIYEGREGALYVGTEGRGLYVISPDRRSVRVYGRTMGDEKILANDDVQSVLEDRAGFLWIGGVDGLTRLDRKSGRATAFLAAPDVKGSLGSSFVTNIVQDSRGTIWVATKGGGLNRFNDSTGTFTALGPAQGLPHSFVYGVLEDGRGKLWLSTDDGIAMYDPANGLVARYGLADGLQGREFNRRAHFRATDGTMYFGGINGVNIVRPDLLSPPSSQPVVSFVSLTTPDARRWAMELTRDSVIKLAHDDNAFTISFAALDFTAPEKVRYEYMLDGIDRDWVPAGDRREATYASVPIGTHVFRVRAASAGADWSPHVAAVTFDVEPAWWATWWARALEVLAIAALILGVIRLRLRRARLRGIELEQRVDEQTRNLIAAQTQLRESLERERESARELVEMTAAVPGAVFQLAATPDGQRTFEFVSEGIARIFTSAAQPATPACDPRQLAERLFGRIVPEDRAALDRALAATREARGDFQLDVRWQPDGDDEPRWLAVQAHAAEHGDGTTVWTGVMTDVTAARRADAERIALESKMAEAHKAESLAVLAGGVAHDFNNMLMSVVVGAELLELQVGSNDRALETVRKIRSAGFRAADLTQQMLAYAGKGQIAIERVNLAALADEMVSLLRVTLPRSVQLTVLTTETPTIVEADPTQLRQIVMNLVTNAGEAIGDRAGHVTVRVAIEDASRDDLDLMHASTEMAEHGPYVVLDVIDDGSGMEASRLARIFDPFFTTKFTGRGLGLAALLGIVRAHKGGLKVISAPDQGTRFMIYLPLASAEPAPSMPTPVRAQPALHMEGTRILVADDEAEIREITRVVLEQLGFEVFEAEDGVGALAQADRLRDIDVYLLDITMPNMTGAAAAEALRARGVAAPIVLMSGYAEEDLLDQGLTANADAFLKKPFLGADLARVLSEVLRVVSS